MSIFGGSFLKNIITFCFLIGFLSYSSPCVSLRMAGGNGWLANGELSYFSTCSIRSLSDLSGLSRSCLITGAAFSEFDITVRILNV